jgi:hypothetical protein
MALDMTTFAAALKQHYVPLTVKNLVYKNNPRTRDDQKRREVWWREHAASSHLRKPPRPFRDLLERFGPKDQ